MSTKTKRVKPALRVTRDYSIFEHHELNRPLHDDPQLEASMKAHGFAPSGAIHCIRAPNGKLKVVQGHHRLAVAMRLGLPVWYIIDDTPFDIFDLEGGKTAWTMNDFAHARASAGDKGCATILSESKKHGIAISITASLLLGHTAKGDAGKTVRRGKFAVTNPEFANRVFRMVDHCKNAGMGFATGRAFAFALAAACLLRKFDDKQFMRQVQLHPRLMVRCDTRADALAQIEQLYNYGTRGNRIPQLAFLALEASKARSAAPVKPKSARH